MAKPFLTYEQQIQTLKDKNLIIADETYATDMLHRYGYFALISGYKDLFKNPITKNYRDDTTFEDIVSIYQFDERLRELTLRYLLHIEQHIRTILAYEFCKTHGENQNAYLSPQNYDISSSRKQREVNKLISNYLQPLISKQTSYDYIEHHKKRHRNVPLWVLINALTFGTVSKMYEYSQPKIRAEVCKEFEGIRQRQLRMILKVLTNFRNICAHNERLFSHKLRYDMPDLPLHQKLSIPTDGQQYIYGKHDYFSVVLTFRYLLSHEDYLEFEDQLSKLIDKFIAENRQIAKANLLHIMGLPPNWKTVTEHEKV